MISDEIKQMARQAAENNNFNEVASEIRDALREQFPSASPRTIKNAFRSLRGISAMPAGREMEEAETQEEITEEKKLNKELRASFTYKNRPLNYDSLSEGNFDEESLRLKPTASANIREILNQLGEFAKKTNDDTVMNNTTKLIDFYARTQMAQTKAPTKKTRIDVAWAEDIGDLQLGKMSSRKRIYNYWKGIDAKHKDVIEAAKEFYEMLMSLDFVMEETESKFLKPFIDAANNFVADYEAGIPNYILKLKPFELPVDNAFNNALYIMDAFNDLRGVMPQTEVVEDMGMQTRGTDDAVSEGAAGATGREALEEEYLSSRGTKTTYDASLPDMSGRAKTPQVVTSKNLMNVDPIFWYKFSDDFSKIRIPKRQLKQVKDIINGVKEKRLVPMEKGSQVIMYETIGLKYRFMGKYQGQQYILDKQALNEFDDWFNKFEANIDDIRDEKIFHLPLSKFVESYGKAETEDKEKINYDKITDATVRFLDNIAKIAEAYKTSLSTYQPETGGGGRGEVYGDSPRFIWAGERGKEREIPALVDKPWNDLLKAINEYYLIPLQGRNFVQAKEKPTWATGHSAMILSIKNAKENAIGAMLDRMVTDSIHLVSPRNIKALTTFIKEARRTGARAFTKDIFRTGKKAVKALDRLFGKEFSSKNKESIGYIIYDMADKLNVDDVGRLSTPYWSNLKELHDKYKDSNQDKYPINMLRYALNTPEFKAWIGLSENKKVQYTDPALAEAVTELDKEFDTFHKMDKVNASLLEAHDTIRKMQDKPVIHARLSLESIEHMDLVINKVHLEQKMDITATEIDRIVKAVASYQSISRDYGINEDTVYTIKALFR